MRGPSQLKNMFAGRQDHESRSHEPMTLSDPVDMALHRRLACHA